MAAADGKRAVGSDDDDDDADAVAADAEDADDEATLRFLSDDGGASACNKAPAPVDISR